MTELIPLTGKSGVRRYLAFRAALYRGDPCYVSTSRFVLESVLCRTTDFIKSSTTLPLLVTENGEPAAEAILIHHPALPYVQVSFFEALPGRAAAVACLLDRAREMQKECDAQGVIVGLNAHISYGVGILTGGFTQKISFDSLYNKPYYSDYFRGLRAMSLSTYRGPTEQVARNLPKLTTPGIRVRPCDKRHFSEEAERMRVLCDRTIGNTYLYFPTERLHFYQLMKDLLPFLRPEHLLFAENAAHDPLGFLFWHPDFNQMLTGGKEYGMTGIAAAWLRRRRRIDTVKINAIGTLSQHATYALIRAFYNCIQNRYRFVETNFVWDCNRPSTLLNRRLFGEHDRTYEVYLL